MTYQQALDAWRRLEASGYSGAFCVSRAIFSLKGPYCLLIRDGSFRQCFSEAEARVRVTKTEYNDTIPVLAFASVWGSL
jgi:hypothetical protein